MVCHLLPFAKVGQYSCQHAKRNEGAYVQAHIKVKSKR